MPVRTKIEMNPALARRISGLDDLARIFFPDNRNHQRAFVAIWLEIKYADNQFLLSSTDISSRYEISSRILDIVRAKLKKLGIIKRISHFNPTYGYRSGWVFSSRCSSMLQKMARMLRSYATATRDSISEEKDRASLNYV
jgi:hypothetical protein